LLSYRGDEGRHERRSGFSGCLQSDDLSQDVSHLIGWPDKVCPERSSLRRHCRVFGGGGSSRPSGLIMLASGHGNRQRNRQVAEIDVAGIH
jgi:hypothetical protein